MKLRIRGDSLRLRLSQTEVRLLERGETVSEEVRFGARNSLRYALSPSPSAQDIRALFSEAQVKVEVPRGLVLDWAGSERTELKATQPNGSEAGLFILIEKDFQCLKPRDHQPEDESDLFPNPHVATGCCGGEDA